MFLRDMTPGPDGNIWYSLLTIDGDQRIGRIARITSAGNVREFSLPEGVFAGNLVTGPEQTIWFVAGSKLSLV